MEEERQKIAVEIAAGVGDGLADTGEVRFVAAEIYGCAAEVEKINQGDQAEDNQAADASVGAKADSLTRFGGFRRSSPP